MKIEWTDIADYLMPPRELNEKADGAPQDEPNLPAVDDKGPVLPQKEATTEKTHLVTLEKLNKLRMGYHNSPILRTIRALALPIATGIVLVIALSPPGWVVAAIVTAAIVTRISMMIMKEPGDTPIAKLKKFSQKVEFELSGMKERLNPKGNYDVVFEVPSEIPNKNPGKIFQGALFNSTTNQLENVSKIEEKNNGKKLAVLHINESWELEQSIGLSGKYTEEEWTQKTAAHKAVIANDHVELTPEQLEEAADWIHEQIQAGHNVYVHCRAGKGRSAMAIAAYLIKYQDMSVEEACLQIKINRQGSTILNKSEGLNAFAEHFNPNTKSNIDKNNFKLSRVFQHAIENHIKNNVDSLKNSELDSLEWVEVISDLEQQLISAHSDKKFHNIKDEIKQSSVMEDFVSNLNAILTEDIQARKMRLEGYKNPNISEQVKADLKIIAALLSPPLSK